MESIKWWTWAILLSSIVAIILLISAPLSYKYGALPLVQALSSSMAALVIAVVALILAAIMGFICVRQGLPMNRNYLIVAMILSLLPTIVMGVQVQKGLSAPPIHDITTDTDNPPVFDKIVDLRRDAPNSLAYGDEVTTKELLIKSQTAYYTDVKSLHSNLGVKKALDRAEQLLASQKLVIVNRDDLKGIIEATATTDWFGFKDDVVVRIKPEDSGSVIDLRSVSRVGRSDLGANARRISEFLAAFSADQVSR